QELGSQPPVGQHAECGKAGRPELDFVVNDKAPDAAPCQYRVGQAMKVFECSRRLRLSRVPFRTTAFRRRAIAPPPTPPRTRAWRPQAPPRSKARRPVTGTSPDSSPSPPRA